MRLSNQEALKQVIAINKLDSRARQITRVADNGFLELAELS
jgi:hypothetical protein